MSPPAPPLPAPRLLAILAADAAGYTRLMAIDDRLTVELLDAARAVFRAACAEQQGRVVDMAGDSVLLAFDSAAAALRCALAVQQRLTAPATIEAGTMRLPFRIGVHLGDVIEKADGSVYGDGVNIAARLQALAEPDEVFVSQGIRELLGARPVADFEDAGEHTLKNVPQPVRAWRALPAGTRAARPAPAALPAEVQRFGGRFELQPQQRRLLVDGAPAALGARAFDLLIELARRPGELRGKHELIEAVWPGVVVEEGNLATQISSLREILGGDVIATIPGRGFRFTATLQAGAATEASPVARSGTPPPPPAAKLQTNLPATLPQLIGRADDVAALNELIDQHRLVSIIGAGGMGKTSVALHITAGRRDAYRHGVCWVELATVTNPEALPASIAAAMGVHIGSGDPLSGLCSALMPLTMLVALDNVEQVVDGVAKVVQAVLDKAPGMRIVVTTQAPLRLAAERAYRIGALAVPQGPLPAAGAMEFGAVALFVERAQAADARFTLTDASAPAVIDLCRQLDGVALAIELAAARAPMLGVQRLATSMSDRLKLLTSGRNRVAPARQQTLRAALEWSHGFLEPTEQAVFRRLAVFVGSGSLTMVQQVVADPERPGDLDEWAVLDALALLVDRSLVVAITPDDAVEPRYRLLDTPRLFAREKLQQADEEEELRRRHSHAVAARFDVAYAEYDSGTIGGDAWMEAMEPDLDNGREALAWALSAGNAVHAVQIAVTLIRALPFSAYRERVAVADALELLIDRLDDAELLCRLCASLPSALGNSQRQRALLLARSVDARLRSLPASVPPPGRWARHSALAGLAKTEALAGRSVDAEATLATARRLADPTWPAVRRVGMAEAERAVALARGDLAAWLQWARQMITLDADRGFLGRPSLANLVDAELAAGDAGQAAAIGQNLVAALASGRDEYALTYARMNLAAALLALDRACEARVHLHAGWAQAPLFDAQPFYADYLAMLAALDGRFESAARIAGFADAANAQVGARESNEAAAISRAAQLARAALGDEAFDCLHAEGAGLRDADITALAFPEPA